MTPDTADFVEVGRFAPHGLDGMGALGGVDIFVRAEDVDKGMDCAPNSDDLWAENAALRAALGSLVDALGDELALEISKNDHVIEHVLRALRHLGPQYEGYRDSWWTGGNEGQATSCSHARFFMGEDNVRRCAFCHVEVPLTGAFGGTDATTEGDR